MKMTGNTILMTGGGSGIGRALAQRFCDLGNDVIITGRRRSALDEAIAGRPRMSAHLLDIEDPEAIRDFVSHLAATRSRVNVLFNNAGITGPSRNWTSGSGGASACVTGNSGAGRAPRSRICWLWA